MKNLYLVRHGTPNFADGIKLCIGRTDIDIGEQGKLEAEKLKDFFKDKLRNGQIKEIFSSPLIRCMHTAEIISGGEKKIIQEEGLMEIYMGCWEGFPLKDIKKELGDEPSDGEKRILALKRFEKSLREIMDKTEGDVICVAHAGVNCAFLASVLGKDIRTSRSLKQPYGGYSHLKYDGEDFSVIDIGLLPMV